MTTFTRLSDLSVDELHKLQSQILDEIQRRKELLDIAKAKASGSASGARKSGSARHSAPASKPASAAARPATLRRAA